MYVMRIELKENKIKQTLNFNKKEYVVNSLFIYFYISFITNLFLF